MTTKIVNKTPWIEKYRPKTISDLVTTNVVLGKIKNMIDDKNIPNIIITGMPGVGKTTTIQCLANHLYGQYRNLGVLELNASDDRGIRTVYDSIIHFCKKKIDLTSKGDHYATHKLVVLDEADNMTVKAQQLINNLMEQYHDTTRFAFTCNNSSDIIEGIQSRCIIFRYKRLTSDQIISKLSNICDIENIKYNDKSIGELAFISQGDLRQAINNLQLAYNDSNEINSETISKLCDDPHPLTIKKLLLECKNNNLKNVLTQLRKLTNMGYSASDISLNILNVLKYLHISEISSDTKIMFMKEIGQTCMVISKGISTELQLAGSLAKMIKLNKNQQAEISQAKKQLLEKQKKVEYC